MHRNRIFMYHTLQFIEFHTTYEKLDCNYSQLEADHAADIKKGVELELSR